MKNWSVLLVSFFALVFLKQILWMGLVPVWHFPDEQAHFSQVQNMAFFAVSHGNTSDEIAMSEILLGTKRDQQGNNKFTHQPWFTIPYSNSVSGVHEQTITDLPKTYTTNLKVREATSYPFLYYSGSMLFYKLFASSSIITRVYSVRFFSLLIFMATTWVVWQIGQLLFQNKFWALGLTTLVAFQPMFSFVGAGVTSDVLFNFFFTLFVYCCLKIIEKPKAQAWLYLFVIIILGQLTKQQMVVALIIALCLLPFRFTPIKQLFCKKTASTIGLILLLSGFLAVAMIFGKAEYIYTFIQSGRNQNQQIFAISLFEHIKFTLLHTYREVLPWYWGVFKWLGVVLPRWVNRVQMGILGITGFGLLWYLVQKVTNFFKTKKLSLFDQKILFLLFSALAYYLALLLWDWQFRRAYNFSFGVQGRYYFPVIIAHMALILVSWRFLWQQVFKKYSPNYVLVILGFWWLILQIIGLRTIIVSYYDVSSWSIFLNQISQYKPWLFKSYSWYLWFSLAILALVLFLRNFIITWRYEKNHKTNC
ncbi:DUF2142 domain-containing protein [Candidatus Beckwithbacteria bacterium]|nr:DUF2142 domain-containing protein [Candidatus Beckwithbacteria bacterium]